MGVKEEKLQKRIQRALDAYVKNSRFLPIVRIEGYYVHSIEKGSKVTIPRRTQ